LAPRYAISFQSPVTSSLLGPNILLNTVATLAINYAIQYTSIILLRVFGSYLRVTETGKHFHTRTEERQVRWKWPRATVHSNVTGVKALDFMKINRKCN